MITRNSKGQFIKGIHPNTEFRKGHKINLGKYHTEKTKKKIREANKGKILSKKTRKKLSQIRQNMSEKTKRKMSKSREGEKNPAWKGGITPKNKIARTSIKFSLWREAVFARDNWTCQKCKKRGNQKLNAHHIFNFAQFINFRFELFNGITFCKKCHKKFHKIYGMANNNREQVDEFIC